MKLEISVWRSTQSNRFFISCCFHENLHEKEMAQLEDEGTTSKDLFCRDKLHCQFTILNSFIVNNTIPYWGRQCYLVAPNKNTSGIMD